MDLINLLDLKLCDREETECKQCSLLLVSNYNITIMSMSIF